jgi:hypothetical protein
MLYIYVIQNQGESYVDRLCSTINSMVGKCDEIIASLQSIDFLCEENKGLIVIGTFYFNGALISETLCSMQQVTSFQIPTRLCMAKFIVDFGIGYAGVNFIPQSGKTNWAAVLFAKNSTLSKYKDSLCPLFNN